jgi:hypothetical protein
MFVLQNVNRFSGNGENYLKMGTTMERGAAAFEGAAMVLRFLGLIVLLHNNQ